MQLHGAPLSLLPSHRDESRNGLLECREYGLPVLSREVVVLLLRGEHIRELQDMLEPDLPGDARFLGELSEETAVRTRRNGVDAEMKLITRRLPIDLDLHVDTSALYALSHRSEERRVGRKCRSGGRAADVRRKRTSSV